MQVGDLIAGSLGILILAVLCVRMAMRKPEEVVDLDYLEGLAREEEDKQAKLYRESRGA